MPYTLKKVKGGFKVHGPSGFKSRKALSKEKAKRQMAAIYANEPKAKKKKPKRKAK